MDTKAGESSSLPSVPESSSLPSTPEPDSLPSTPDPERLPSTPEPDSLPSTLESGSLPPVGQKKSITKNYRYVSGGLAWLYMTPVSYMTCLYIHDIPCHI